MKQEIVLPKFKVPGQTSWLVRVVWIAGGLVLLQAAAVVLFLSLQKSSREAEQQRAAAEQQRALDAQRVAAAEAAALAAAQAAQAARAAAGRLPPRGASLASTKPLSAAAAASTSPGTRATTRGHVLRKKPPRQGRFVASKGSGRAGGKTLGKMSGKGAKVGGRAGRGAGHPPTKAGAARASASKKKPAGGDAIDDILRGFK